MICSALVLHILSTVSLFILKQFSQLLILLLAYTASGLGHIKL